MLIIHTQLIDDVTDCLIKTIIEGNDDGEKCEGKATLIIHKQLMEDLTNNLLMTKKQRVMTRRKLLRKCHAYNPQTTEVVTDSCAGVQSINPRTDWAEEEL